MVSKIGSFYTLSACIDKIPNVKLEDWECINEYQKKYFEIYKNCTGAKIPEIESKVSVGDVKPVNDFLRERGFDIQLEPLVTEKDLAIASILELSLKWTRKGNKLTINNDGKKYSGVGLEDNVEIVYCKGFHGAVAKITTGNGDIVYITIPTRIPKDSFEILDMARVIINSEKSSAHQVYENIVSFPMIDLDTQPDISWIVGMKNDIIDSEYWYEIKQALQQTKVKIDEIGVVIKEAVALGMRCYCASFDFRVPLVIDKPFLFVVERKGLKEPLFSAYLDIECWVK
jgi:hypothetical protein